MESEAEVEDSRASGETMNLNDLPKMQAAIDCLARSWWRRTIINLVGGGDRGVRIERKKE